MIDIVEMRRIRERNSPVQSQRLFDFLTQGRRRRFVICDLPQVVGRPRPGLKPSLFDILPAVRKGHTSFEKKFARGHPLELEPPMLIGCAGALKEENGIANHKVLSKSDFQNVADVG